jgi:type I restriction enzyme S subunit
MLKNKALQKNIPKDWKQLKISDVATVYSGATPKTSEGAYWSGDIYWVTPKDLSRLDSRFIINTERKITDKGLKNCSAVLIPANSLVMSSRAPIGYLAINKVPVATNQGCKTMTPNKDIDVQYLYYYLDRNIDLVKRLGTGSTFAEVGRSAVESVEVLVPTLLEQKKIAEILSSVDDEIKKTEEIISATEKLNKGLMQNLFSFRNKADVRKLALKDIGKVAMCKRVFKKETLSSGEIPFYKIGTFGKKPDAFISQKLYDTYRSKFSFPKKGDVLLSASGTIGRKVRYDGKPAYFQDSNIIWLEHDESKVLNDFLFYLYDSIEWQTEGSTIKRLYNDLFLKKIIPVPPIAEQKRVVEILSSLEEKILVNKKIKSKLLLLKKGLMQDLLTGKKRTI